MVLGMDLSVWMDAKQLLKIFSKWSVCANHSAEIHSMGMMVGISEKAPGLIGLTKRKMRHEPSYGFSSGHRICSRISAVQNVLGDLIHFMFSVVIKFGDECLKANCKTMVLKCAKLMGVSGMLLILLER